ncbi:MAG: phospho-N-acetylmuramoyl-pentapeptide-transferase, partial [Lachnospiraceae bacterium]|nr:phospho-N-acetylmuramoyl-pentapeptide-transferase [Lachnospiraceae bacterium]
MFRELLTPVVLPIVGAFFITIVLGPVIIPYLRKLKFGQTVRDDGPQSHLKKNGTPTMGGIIFLISITVMTLPFIKTYPNIVPVLFLTLGFGLIGFLDDYIKVVLKRSMGLTSMQKMIGQIIVTAIFAYYLIAIADVDLAMRIPFMDKAVDLGIFTIPVMFFIVIGTVNGSNFTDGIDGQESSVTIMIATFFAVVSVGMDAGIEPVACAVIGGLLGFLMFNVYPASVFMGDTGSLALGGFVAGCAYMTGLQLFIPIVAFIYMLEVASV